MGDNKKVLVPVVSKKRHCHCCRKRRKHHRRAISLLALGALAAAIHKELSKPAHSREWHGHLAGVVPYDLRVPTADKIKDRLFNPDGPVISPKTFGVGWDPNIGRIAKEVRDFTDHPDPGTLESTEGDIDSDGDFFETDYFKD